MPQVPHHVVQCTVGGTSTPPRGTVYSSATSHATFSQFTFSALAAAETESDREAMFFFASYFPAARACVMQLSPVVWALWAGGMGAMGSWYGRYEQVA